MWRSPMTKLAVALAALLRSWRVAKRLPPTRHPRRIRIVEIPKSPTTAGRARNLAGRTALD
jgi:hypothetical protein